MSFSRAYLNGLDLAFDATHAEAAGNEDAVDAAEDLVQVGGLEVVRRDPLDLEVRAVGEARVLQALDDGQVRVGQTSRTCR